MILHTLIVAESQSLRRRLSAALESPDVRLSSVRPSAKAWARAGREGFHLIVASESDLPADADELLATLRGTPERTELILIAQDDDPETRARWLALGAMSVVSRYVPDRTLGETLRALLRRLVRTHETEVVAETASPPASLGDFVSNSLAMEQLLGLAARVADSDASLLVLGETGVGKEWLSRAIHASSPRRTGPFVAVNCAAVPEGLVESELFGHVEGAFTGAMRNRRGHFEMAHGGTLFLDEVVDLPPAVQAKLLRAIQDRTVQPVGAEEPLRVDVRIIAATNRDLEAAVRAGEFRRDLYYRLGVVTLTVPPLRERKDDIPLLVDTYLQRFAVQLVRPVDTVSADAMAALIDYPWPGNVRELINVIERGVLLSEGGELTTADLPPLIAGGRSGAVRSVAPEHGIPERILHRPLAAAREEWLETLERAYLTNVLTETRGHLAEAARVSGIGTRTLYNKMRRYGLRKERFRLLEER